MRIFSYRNFDSSLTAAVIFVRCPEIEYIKNSDVDSWILHMKNEQKKMGEEGKRYADRCARMLYLVKEVDEAAKVVMQCNVPLKEGNEVMFVLDFSTKRLRFEFDCSLEDLEKHLA